MNRTPSILLIYVSEDKSHTEVLSVDDAKAMHYNLIESGYLHTNTIDACNYIKHLLNDCNVNITKEVKKLKK